MTEKLLIWGTLITFSVVDLAIYMVINDDKYFIGSQVFLAASFLVTLFKEVK